MEQPIPITAGVSAEYIPPHMDIALIQRQGRAAIAKLESDLNALKIRGRDGRADSEGMHPDVRPKIEALEGEIRRTREGLEQDIAAIRQRYPHPFVFTLKIPTSIERDMINSRLIRLGLTNVSQQNMRATMIEELFSMDWGKGSAEANEVHAEELANFLDGCWQRQEVHDSAIAQWEEQERERIMDEAFGAPPRERAPLPPKIITVRENARMQLLVDRVMAESEKMRELSAKAADFNRLNSILLFRIHVLGVRRGEEALPIAWDHRLDVMTDGCAAGIRQLLDDVTWSDLIAHINNMYLLNGYEEKNSDSPLEKLPDQTGLPEPNGDTEASGGSLTTSSITPVLVVESGTIIEQSSGSISDSAIVPATEAQSAFPTGEA